MILGQITVTYRTAREYDDDYVTYRSTATYTGNCIQITHRLHTNTVYIKITYYTLHTNYIQITTYIKYHTSTYGLHTIYTWVNVIQLTYELHTNYIRMPSRSHT